MFSALHLAWKLLRNIAVRAWRKMSVPTISAGTREGDQPTHPLSCVGAMNPQECDAAPWLTRLVADLASIAHAGCHSFQFGAPSSTRQQVSSSTLGSEKMKSFLRSVSLTKKTNFKWQNPKLSKLPLRGLAVTWYQHIRVSEAQSTLQPHHTEFGKHLVYPVMGLHQLSACQHGGLETQPMLPAWPQVERRAF